MKRMTIFCFLVLTLAWPGAASALELVINNSARCEAKVALAYERNGQKVVEGWHKVQAGQSLSLHLYLAGQDGLYAHVVFEYPQGPQPFEKTPLTAEPPLRDIHFRYAGPDPSGPTWRKALFFRLEAIPPQEKLYLNLNAAP